MIRVYMFRQADCFIRFTLRPSASFDLFSFPWKKYRVNKPSRGTDGLLQATFTPRSHLSMYLKYRYKRKERDWTGSKGTLTLPIFHHLLRLS